MADTHSLQVQEDEQGKRLDAYLSTALPQLSRTRLKALIEEGQVTLDGRVLTTPSFKVQQGQSVTVSIPSITAPTLAAQAMDLEILFEDEDILVLNKPAGLVVHPGAGNADMTLVNGLIAHCGNSLSGIGGVGRPGIVHRLDKGTSGLMVVAKNDLAHQGLTAQFADRTLSREYLAFVWGAPNPLDGTVDKPIGRSPHNRQKMAVRVHGGKEAITHYKTKEMFGRDASLVSCRLQTGRTHQIRVHMTHISAPLLGDPLYGSVPKRVSPILRAEIEALLTPERPALHAYRLKLRHPRTDKALSFEVPLPEDLEALYAFLEGLI